MKWRKRGYLLAAMLALASATIQAADVTITVNGKVVAKPCTVSTTNATVDLGDLYSGCRGEALTQSRSDSGVYTGLLLCKPRQP